VRARARPKARCSGIWFDVLAMLVAPMILAAFRSLTGSKHHAYTASEGTP